MASIFGQKGKKMSMLCITILNSLKNAAYSKGYGHYFTPSFNVTFHSKTWNKWATPNFVCFWVYACVCIQVLMTGGGSGGSRAQVQNLAFWLLGKQVLDIPVSVSCLWIGQDSHCISLASLRIKKKKTQQKVQSTPPPGTLRSTFPLSARLINTLLF